jgi:hypothetical protein
MQNLYDNLILFVITAYSTYDSTAPILFDFILQLL